MQSLFKFTSCITPAIKQIKNYHIVHKNIPSPYNYVTTSDINPTSILSTHLANIIKGLNTYDKNNVVQIKEISSDTYEITFFSNYMVNNTSSFTTTNMRNYIKYKGCISLTKVKVIEKEPVSDLNKDEIAYLNTMSNIFAAKN